jgi:7-keto-8-aminopelargonate synthetase-like enzyme
LQPATLASSIAAANICLSDDFPKYQLEINEKMQFFIDYCKELGLPLVSTDFTPIFYIGVGSVEVLTKMTKFLMTQGHFVTNMVFPVVPVNNSGFRLCLTRHHTIEDIKEVLDMIADALYIYLKEEGTTMEEIYNAFGITELQR